MSRRCINCQGPVQHERIELLDSHFCAACAHRIYASGGRTEAKQFRRPPPASKQLQLSWTSSSVSTNVVSAYKAKPRPKALIETVED